MALQQGSYLGSVRDLTTLCQRCVIDPDTRCWHLRTSNGSRLRRAARAIPTVTAVGRGKVSARRLAVEFAAGRPLPSALVVAACSMAFDCVNPAHLKRVSRHQHGEIARLTGASRTPAKTVAARCNSRHNAKLTHELAAWARESPQSQQACAHALGVCQDLISQIRRYRAWAPPSPIGSVFAIGGAR